MPRRSGSWRGALGGGARRGTTAAHALELVAHLGAEDLRPLPEDPGLPLALALEERDAGGAAERANRAEERVHLLARPREETGVLDRAPDRLQRLGGARGPERLRGAGPLRLV